MKVNMLSRVADGMFWLDRYMERTDGMMLTLNIYSQIHYLRQSKSQFGQKSGD